MVAVEMMLTTLAVGTLELEGVCELLEGVCELLEAEQSCVMVAHKKGLKVGVAARIDSNQLVFHPRCRKKNLVPMG